MPKAALLDAVLPNAIQEPCRERKDDRREHREFGKSSLKRRSHVSPPSCGECLCRACAHSDCQPHHVHVFGAPAEISGAAPRHLMGTDAV